MNIEEFRLDNGLRVVLVQDHRAPVATHSVWYKVGSMDEKPGKTGLAHMTEHLMFKGTPRHPAGVMDKIVQRKGGIQNAFTSYDFTAYFQKIPVGELATMMDLESDRMANLALNDEVFLPERKVVAEERKLTTESNPTERFFETVLRRHYAHHAYGHPIIGWAEDIQGYTVEDALAWYREHYAPNNATLVVVGDIDAASLKPLAEDYYGKVPAYDVPGRKAAAEPKRSGPLEQITVDAQVQVPTWLRMYRTPTQFAGVAGAPVVKGEATALWVLAEILGGSDTARLYQALVVEQELADAAQASYDVVRAGEGTLDFSVQPKEGVTLDRIGPAVDALLGELLDKGVSVAELAKAKTSLRSDEIYARDDAFTTMYRLGVWVCAGGEPAHVDDWQDELAAMAVEDVNAVARKYLRADACTLAVLAGRREQLGTLVPTADH